MKVILRGLEIVALLLLWTPAHAQQSDQSFEQFKQQEEQAFRQYSEQTTRECEAFAKAEREAYEQFKAEVQRQWGEFTGSTRKDWVEYNEDASARTRVDFEKGEAKVEVLVSAEEEATSKLERMVEKLVMDPGKSSDYKVTMPDGKVHAPKPLGKKPVLAEQVRTAKGAPVTRQNAKTFAQEVVKKQTVKRATVTGTDGVKRVKATVTIPLVPDHLRRRAERYVPLVRRTAKRFDLETPLVFALIHTESYFNPKARSSAPAYGLMQLVPKSGGRDAYQYVYKKDRVLPPGYFYVPEQNIELGCGYLQFLRRKVFRDVRDDRKATYCIVSAYNTGAGNVSRAITGNRKIRKAVPRIERMSAKNLYAKLRKDLPYEETQEYLKKVTERMTLYEEWR